MFISKIEAWNKVYNTELSIIKKELIFYTMFEYELKKFLETDKQTKLLKVLVTELVSRNLNLECIKKVLLSRDTKNILHDLIRIGTVEKTYYLYIKPLT